MKKTALISLLLVLIIQQTPPNSLFGDDHGKGRDQPRQGGGEGPKGGRPEGNREQGRGNRPAESPHVERNRGGTSQQRGWSGNRGGERSPTGTPRVVNPGAVNSGAGNPRAGNSAAGNPRAGNSAAGNQRAIWQRSPSMSRTISPSSSSHIYNYHQRDASNRAINIQRDGRESGYRGADYNRHRDGRTREQMRRFINSHPLPRNTGRGTAQPYRNQQEIQRASTPQFRTIEQNIRDYVNKRHIGRRQWFNNNFWYAHRYYPRYYAVNRNWWGGATPIGISSWLGWSSAPYFYDNYVDYGNTAAGWTAGDFYAENDVLPLDYSEQSLNIDRDEDTSGEWMPLGVFSIIQDGDNETSANLFIQLALSKDGSLAGTIYDASSDKIYEVDGIVDESSQRAVWKLPSLSDSPIMEAGLYNLTQGAAPSRLYFSKGTTQNRLLIRIDEER